MKQLLLGLLVSLGLSTEWGTSFSVRTANDDSQPLDYELEKAKKLDKAIHDVEEEVERKKITNRT